ncbi:MAG: exodeoxyribonuclease III, partial [Bacilli bacterium]
YLYPNTIKYSWWSYMQNAREKNIGWRIDYFVISKDIKDKIIDAKIHDNVFGSDHCPVELNVQI